MSNFSDQAPGASYRNFCRTYGLANKSPTNNNSGIKWKKPAEFENTEKPDKFRNTEILTNNNFKRNGTYTKSGRWVKPRNMKNQTINLPFAKMPEFNSQEQNQKPHKTESFTLIENSNNRTVPVFGSSILIPGKVLVADPLEFQKNSPQTSTLLKKEQIHNNNRNNSNSNNNYYPTQNHNHNQKIESNGPNPEILWKKPKTLSKIETDLTKNSESSITLENGALGISPIKSVNDIDNHRPTPDWYAAPEPQENLSRNPLLIMKNVSKNDIAIHYKVMEELSQMIFV